MKTIHFACGAIYETENAPELNRKGLPVRMLVYAHGGAVCPPKVNGTPANCLWNCPATVRASGRKEERAWVGDAAVKPQGEPVRCVLCQPTNLTEVGK